MKGIILKDLYENFRILKTGFLTSQQFFSSSMLIEAMQTGDLFFLKNISLC